MQLVRSPSLTGQAARFNTKLEIMTAAFAIP